MIVRCSWEQLVFFFTSCFFALLSLTFAFDGLNDHAQQVAAECQKGQRGHAQLKDFLHFTRFFVGPRRFVVADLFAEIVIVSWEQLQLCRFLLNFIAR